MGAFLKITMLYPAREDAWAQKIFSAAASLRGREKARRALRQRHRWPLVLWLCLQNPVLHLGSVSAAQA